MSDKNSPHAPTPLMHSLCISLLISLLLGVSSAAAAAAAAEGEKSKPPYTTGIGKNGLQTLTLHGDGKSSVEVYLYGAHVTSWKNKHGEELIFLSNKSLFEVTKSIRGGIPLIFPQFSNLGNLPSHGFARTSFWSIDNSSRRLHTNSSDKTFVDLILKSTNDSLKIWPHKFAFRLRVTLGSDASLSLTSRIVNTDKVDKPFNFTFAYHTYFSISNISKVSVEGLKNLWYRDNTIKNKTTTSFYDPNNTVTFNSELDRTYLSTPSTITVLDHEMNRTFTLRKHGLPDAVVWNPWAKNVTDLGVGDYKHMVCVEAAAIEKPVSLKPGEKWKGSVHLSEAPSSACSGN